MPELPADRSTPSRPTPAFLEGGGTMGALMRAHDWSTSSLGPPEGWPSPLRTTVRLLLNSGHPMYIWWGEDGACLYNDAYSLSIGPERHPCSLGRPAREVWDEIWDIIGPQIEQVMAGRGATWHENQLVPITRNGRREEVYWTYSYSPIGDESATSGVGGVLVVCAETTPQVLAEQRLALQADRQRALFEQAPGFICILNGPDHRFEFVNAAYTRLIGARDLLGKPVREVVPEVEGQGYFELLDQVLTSGQPFVATDQSLRVRRSPTGTEEERFIDFIYQPTVDEQGRVTGIFVEGHDVTEAHRLSQAERQIQQQLKLMVDELNHRVKNTLAIIQGIAHQTFRPGVDSNAARQAFEGRLIALAATYNVLTDAHWAGTSLQEIVAEAVRAHAPDFSRLTVEGPAVSVAPQTAVAVALALHELATNATKYGALCNDEGRVGVRWTWERDGVVRLVWAEDGGPTVTPPSQSGFGTRMIERAMAAEPGGAVTLDFAPEGVRCEITFSPADEG